MQRGAQDRVRTRNLVRLRRAVEKTVQETVMRGDRRFERRPQCFVVRFLRRIDRREPRLPLPRQRMKAARYAQRQRMKSVMEYLYGAA